MPKCTILLAPRDVMSSVFFKSDAAVIIKEALDRYENAGSFRTHLFGEDAAEEAFDLTNNPGRQDERVSKYGRGRSVSSGDVVDVDGVKYACLSVGWKQL